VETWIWQPLVLLAGGAAMHWLWHSVKQMPKRSARSSSAGDAWRTEYDLELAELKSTVTGLSSTLRKLHGRESQRLRKDSNDSSQSSNPLADKNELRQKYGILPRARDAD
jgi:hypothetical protein